VAYPGGVLEARRKGFWKGDYELNVDGRPLTRWDAKTWRTGGWFELDGRRYEVRANGWGTRYEMTDPTGMPVAGAHRVGRKRWTVEAGGRTYGFERASFWRSEERLVADGRPVGSVRRVSAWRGDAVADLPGLPLPVQVFVFTVVLTAWDAAATAAAGSSGGGGGGGG
jgi:hypothetical protein